MKKNHFIASSGCLKLSPVGGGRSLPVVAVLERVAEAEAVAPIEEAKIIIAGGRGVGGPEGFKIIEDLAAALGGVVGASRAGVDAGWISYAHQVGQTGKIVKPQLYVALGISGAIQDKVGMQTAETIIAVNRDPEAPIVEFADLFVVGDVFEVVPELVAALKAFPRQALHAWRLAFHRPVTGMRLDFEAAPPLDFEGLLAVLATLAWRLTRWFFRTRRILAFRAATADLVGRAEANLAAVSERIDAVRVYDSYEGPPLEAYGVSYDFVEQFWRHFNDVYIVVFPAERAAEVNAILGVNSDPQTNFRNAAERALAEAGSLTGREQFFAWFNRGSNLVYLQDYAGAAQAYDMAFSLYAQLPNRNARGGCSGIWTDPIAPTTIQAATRMCSTWPIRRWSMWISLSWRKPTTGAGWQKLPWATGRERSRT